MQAQDGVAGPIQLAKTKIATIDTVPNIVGLLEHLH